MPCSTAGELDRFVPDACEGAIIVCTGCSWTVCPPAMTMHGVVAADPDMFTCPETDPRFCEGSAASDGIAATSAALSPAVIGGSLATVNIAPALAGIDDMDSFSMCDTDVVLGVNVPPAAMTASIADCEGTIPGGYCTMVPGP